MVAVRGPGLVFVFASLTTVRLASQLMRNLLGTHLGHSAIYNMCRIMEDRRVRVAQPAWVRAAWRPQGLLKEAPCVGSMPRHRLMRSFLFWWGGCSRSES